MSDAAQRIRQRDLRAIARAATAIENGSPSAAALLKELFSATGRATILGITGAPGAGKSTLVDQLAKAYRAQNIPIGIIAVDPSSPFTGGAILGDRIRMQQHHADPGVFIRSMATRGHLGGLARSTLEIALLLDAAGSETVLIETVGVGQDEIEIARLADVCCVVLVPGMGDDVQALKAGIMEIADVFVINKADLAGADKLEQELKAMLSLTHLDVPIVRTVASDGSGIDGAIDAIRQVKARKSRDGEKLWTNRLREMLRERLLERLPAAEFEAAARRVSARQTDPYTVVEEWLERYHFKP